MIKVAKEIHSQFPMMQPGSIDYVSGGYEVDIESGEDFVSVHHSLIGDTLVSRYVREGKAVFATEVSSPYSTYRKIFKHEWTQAEPSLEAMQSILVDKEKEVSPVYYRPLVVMRESIEQEKINLQAEDGVHELFYGQEMLILPGTILAKDVFWNSDDYLFKLLKIGVKEELKKGTFEVNGITDEGFYFKVDFAPDLYTLITKAQGDQCNFRDAILTFALSEGLNIIYREYQKCGNRESEDREDENEESEKWKGYPALCRLHELICKKELDPWDGGNFKPEKIATALKPIIGVMRNDEDD